MFNNKKYAFFLSLFLITPSMHTASDTQTTMHLVGKTAIATGICFVVGIIGSAVLNSYKSDNPEITSLKTCKFLTLCKLSQELYNKYEKELAAIFNGHIINSSLSAVKILNSDIKQLQTAVSDTLAQQSYPYPQHIIEDRIRFAKNLLTCLFCLYTHMINDPSYIIDVQNERTWKLWCSSKGSLDFSDEKRKKVTPVAEPVQDIVARESESSKTELNTPNSTSIFDFSHPAADL